MNFMKSRPYCIPLCHFFLHIPFFASHPGTPQTPTPNPVPHYEVVVLQKCRVHTMELVAWGNLHPSTKNGGEDPGSLAVNIAI